MFASVLVALLAEGVDRNCLSLAKSASFANVALLAEGVDRNKVDDVEKYKVYKSPSSRRAWIEILVRERARWYNGCRPPRGGRG